MKNKIRPLLAGLVFFAACTATQAAERERSISVNGDALVYITPDVADVRIGIETFSSSLETVTSQSEAAARSLVAAIRSQGVQERHIQTRELNLEIRYREATPYLGVAGYLARREYTVTLVDPSRTDAIVQTALTHGANLLLGVDYRSSDPRTYRDQARRMAVRAAREKAELLAGELGETVGRPQRIDEHAFNIFGNVQRGSQNAYQRMDGAELTDGASIPMGQIAVQATVSVTFDLADPR